MVYTLNVDPFYNYFAVFLYLFWVHCYGDNNLPSLSVLQLFYGTAEVIFQYSSYVHK